MHRTSPTLVVFAVVLIAAPASAQTIPTAQQEMQSAQFLVGKWSCTHTVGDFSGTYTTTYASVLGSAWLEQTYDFPVTREDAAVHADYFLGYDVRVDRWVRFGAHSNAQYYGMLGTRADNVWSWSYVLPGLSGRALPPEALEAVRQLRTAVTLVREPRDEQRERLGVPGDP